MTTQPQIDAQGNLVMTRGRPVIVDSTLQRIRENLRIVLGEWFLDLTVGVPWFTEILTESPNLDQIRSAISDTIVNTEGVTGLPSLILDFDHVRRVLTGSFVALGPNGEQLPGAL